MIIGGTVLNAVPQLPDAAGAGGLAAGEPVSTCAPIVGARAYSGTGSWWLRLPAQGCSRRSGRTIAPRAVKMPLAFKASAICLSVFSPASVLFG
jgi:hypothetical protein